MFITIVPLSYLHKLMSNSEGMILVMVAVLVFIVKRQGVGLDKWFSNFGVRY